ncbi:MAG: hypothetical protein QOD86_654 [Miltoncostaeaceae bacterium]|nr:hypothetical protein [Miltoncostaeaceae bacterium]
MAVFLGTVAVVGLALLGLWQPLLWIGAGLALGLVVLYVIGHTGADDPVAEIERNSLQRR